MTDRKQVLLGGLVVFSVSLLTYSSASRIGLVNNDWYYLDQVARLNLPDYLRQYFDPRLQTGWYRPIFGILYLVVYSLFGANASAHHLAHILLHSATGALLFFLVKHVSARIRIALIAGLIYVGLPIYSRAVYWPSAPDPLSMFIYLLAIWFWIKHLETGGSRYAILTVFAFVLDIMTKETSVTLPIVLVLVDRMLVQRQVDRNGLALRYLPFLVTLPVYLLIEFAIQHNGSYVSMASYGIGSYMVSNFVRAMALVAFPWDIGGVSKYLWLGLATIVFLFVMMVKRSKELAFLGIFAILNLLPVIGFPPKWFETRYLYISTMTSAILMACLLEWMWRRLGRTRWVAALISAAIAIVVLGNSVGVTQAATNWGEIARQRRIPFREIVRQHPTFPPDTGVYFINTANVPFYDLSVMFLLQYGKGVTVRSATENETAGLREHDASFVYYFNAQGDPVETAVDPKGIVQSNLSLPVDFTAPVRLEGYEVPRRSIKRGDPLIVLLYWRATGQVNKDYTVFAHLVADYGKMVEGFDSQPRGGDVSTSSWRTDQFIVDPIVIEDTSQVPPGSDYRLEIGMYYRPTMERLGIKNAQSEKVADTIILQSFDVLN